MAYYRGAITIQPKVATLTHDTAIFKMDPYCVVWLGNQSARTSTHHDGGRNPHWNNVLTLIRNQEDIIRFLIYDRDTVAPDAFVAEGEFHLSMYQGGAFEERIPLRFGGKPAGELHFNIMMPPGAALGHPQGYPQQSNISTGPTDQRSVSKVIIEERRHLGEEVKETFSSEPEQPISAQADPAH